MNLAPIATIEEITVDVIAGRERNNALTKSLFVQFGYTEFATLPLKAQHAIDAIVACQWDMEDMVAAEGNKA